MMMLLAEARIQRDMSYFYLLLQLPCLYLTEIGWLKYEKQVICFRRLDVNITREDPQKYHNIFLFFYGFCMSYFSALRWLLRCLNPHWVL